ncbi:MAG: pilus assembly protein [Acidobacteriota bacterium]|nr:pilus assembly protein [Blastocatellia bacterium]MDW8239455.1 pilus assembly protein [Acidobacteriota bacterium]
MKLNLRSLTHSLKMVTCRWRQRGQSLAEFGLLAPVAILMIAGLIDVGRLAVSEHIIRAASREFAHLATVSDLSNAEIRTKVIQRIQSMGIDPNDVVITVTGANGAAGQPAQVTLNYRVELTALSFILPRDYIQLTASTVMFNE